jgi:hypothetical protein
VTIFPWACRKILPLFRATDVTLYSGAAMAGVMRRTARLAFHSR